MIPRAAPDGLLLGKPVPSLESRPRACFPRIMPRSATADAVDRTTAVPGRANVNPGNARDADAAVKDLMSNGTYTKILQKWGVQSGAISNPVINGAIR